METVKYVTMYLEEAVVVALVGVTLVAGVYQLVREKVRESRRSHAEVVHQPVER